MLKKTAPKVSASKQRKSDAASIFAEFEKGAQANVRLASLPVRIQKKLAAECAERNIKPIDVFKSAVEARYVGPSVDELDGKLDAIGAKLVERARIDQDLIAAMERNTDAHNQLATAVRRIDLDAANRTQASEAKWQEHLSRSAAEIRSEIGQMSEKIVDGVGRNVGQGVNRLSIEQTNWAARIEQALNQSPSRQPTDARDVRDALALHNQKTEEALTALVKELTAALQSAVSGMWAECIQAATAQGYELQPAQLESITNRVSADVSKTVSAQLKIAATDEISTAVAAGLAAGLDQLLSQKRQSQPARAATGTAPR